MWQETLTCRPFWKNVGKRKMVHFYAELHLIWCVLFFSEKYTCKDTAGGSYMNCSNATGSVLEIAFHGWRVGGRLSHQQQWPVVGLPSVIRHLTGRICCEWHFLFCLEPFNLAEQSLHNYHSLKLFLYKSTPFLLSRYVLWKKGKHLSLSKNYWHNVR